VTLREKLIFDGVLIPAEDVRDLPPLVIPPAYGEPVLRLDGLARRAESVDHYLGLDRDTWLAGRRLAKEEHGP